MLLDADEIVVDGLVYRAVRPEALKRWRPTSAGDPACGGADVDAERDAVNGSSYDLRNDGRVAFGLHLGERFRLVRALEVSESSGPVSPELCTIFGANGAERGLSSLETVDAPCLALVDWLTCSWSVPECPPTLRNGRLLRINEDGELVREVLTKTRVRSSATSVGLFHHNGRIHFDGNPVKWITGQNVIGTWDLGKLWESLIAHLSWCLGMDVSPFSHDDVTITRLDLTQMVKAATPDDARAIVRGLGGVLHSGLRKSSTYMLGEGSNWFRIKWYHKGDEIRANKKQNSIVTPEKVDRFWRFEIEVHREYLKRKNLDRLSKWTKNPCLFGDTMLNITDEIDVSLGNADPIDPAIFANKKDRMLYRSWFCGDDIFEGVHRNTKARMRLRFLTRYGVDLYLHPATIDRGTLSGGKVLSFAWAQLRRQMESVAGTPAVSLSKAANY